MDCKILLKFSNGLKLGHLLDSVGLMHADSVSKAFETSLKPILKI